MSTNRMTENSICADMARVQVETDKSKGATMALHRIETELDRARAAEMQQATTIKALADALEARGLHAEGCPRIRIDQFYSECTCGLGAALRLAGRLP